MLAVVHQALGTPPPRSMRLTLVCDCSLLLQENPFYLQAKGEKDGASKDGKRDSKASGSKKK